jgi:lysophospholipase L1-like esterase
MMHSTIFFTTILSLLLSTERTASNSFPHLNNTDSLRIVVLGSSTAEGSGPLNPDNAWVNRYRSYLQSANQNSEVINLARSGYTTYKIMPDGFIPPPTKPTVDSDRNITKALSLNPTAIIINMPSNDATIGISVAEQLTNYDSILSVASAYNVPVWITTTQPRNLAQSGRNILMDMRDSTFARFGDKAIDFWYGLAQYNGYIKPEFDSGDGVHLNDAAHKFCLSAFRFQGLDLQNSGCSLYNRRMKQF